MGASIVSLFFVSCGSNQISLDVVLASNATQNPLEEISQQLQLGASAGIYFVMDELENPPASIDDVLQGGGQTSDPNPNGVGNDPLQDEFKVSTSSLKPAAFYRIRMVARDLNGAITHIGVGDCPVNLSLKGNNTVKICFGENLQNHPPICPGLVNFNDCPGIDDGSSGQVQ